MPFATDPYRTLGLSPGASLNEIRSAYRRLAKQYHPDAAGDRTLPRFLAIQAAYERLVDGEGRLRPRADGGPGGGNGANAGAAARGAARETPREPWRADATRARASRDAWRTRRAGGGGSYGGSGPGATGGAADPTPGGSVPRGGAASGRSGPGGPRRQGAEHGRRTTRRATPGSTTYDEAAETPLDPGWSGGAWYGPSSGTYWTINPREYADPRKHGPEYQARARRAADEAGDDPAGEAGGSGDDSVVFERAPGRRRTGAAIPASMATLAVAVPALALLLVGTIRGTPPDPAVLLVAGAACVGWLAVVIARATRAPAPPDLFADRGEPQGPDDPPNPSDPVR